MAVKMQMLMINVQKSVRAIFWYVLNATEARGTVHHHSTNKRPPSR